MSKLEEVGVSVFDAPVAGHFEKHFVIFPCEDQGVVNDAPIFLEMIGWFISIIGFFRSEIGIEVLSVGTNTYVKWCILLPNNLNRPIGVFSNHPRKFNRSRVGSRLNNEGKVLHVSRL